MISKKPQNIPISLDTNVERSDNNGREKYSFESKLGHSFISAASGFEIKLKEVGEKKSGVVNSKTHNFESLGSYS